MLLPLMFVAESLVDRADCERIRIRIHATSTNSSILLSGNIVPSVVDVYSVIYVVILMKDDGDAAMRCPNNWKGEKIISKIS